MEISKKKFAASLTLAIIVALAVGASIGNTLFLLPVYQVGYEHGLTDMQKALDKAGVFTNWQLNPDGSYTISVIGSDGALQCQYTGRFDMIVQQYRDGKLISQSLHAMTVTDFGKDWIEQQIFSDVNYTDNALYISSSNAETAVSTAWTILPSEITNNGLARAVGEYVSTGVGAANVSKTFSISGTVSSCLYGINAGPYATYDNSLIAAEQQGSGARKNMVAGDTLAITVQWSHI